MICNEIRQQFGLKNENITILKKSLDARSKRNIHYLIKAEINDDTASINPTEVYKPSKIGQKSCHVIGFGPAGIYAALELLAAGIKPIIIERGKPVKERRRDLAKLNKELLVNDESNYCFGEGGAGTYSDGKLYTRSKKRGDVAKVLAAFVQFGAISDINFEAHPHIGTNKLPAIIEKMRKYIIENGGEILFNTCLTDLTIIGNKVQSITVNNIDKHSVENIILATGHSARDIYYLLERKKIALELKAFALGVRVEHPQLMVDEMQYHCKLRGDYLPAASYSLVNQVGKRGVFSFCMCPGGIIAPAATGQNQVVVNGWSPSKRNGQFANSGMVVQLFEDDFKQFNKMGSLAGLGFQKSVEERCYEATGSIKAPAQRIGDFLNGRFSAAINANSYIPGVDSAQLSDVLNPFITQALKEGILNFGKKLHGFDSNEGIMVATESRTSSPVKIPRDTETLQHTQLTNLYPCGEGAGYAGGIVSAALDGMACANAIIKKN